MLRLSRRAKYPLWLGAVLILIAAPLATTLPNADAAEVNSCTALRTGDSVALSWVDDGGRHIVRRNDLWLATPGLDINTYVDDNAPADASYGIRTRVDGVATDRACTVFVDGERCVFSRTGSRATIEWIDDGGSHVVRRAGSWLFTPGVGTSRYVDTLSPVDSTYEIRTRAGGDQTTTPCIEREAQAAAERVIHVSIDGLRVDAITPELMPNLTRLVATGASTMNARSDPKVTRTLPNHTSQLTGLAVKFHGVDYNEDQGLTIHQEAGRYVPSVYDVVHDNGGRTVALVGKSKFDVHDRSWDELNGAPDTTGGDDGRDKIDRFEREPPELTADMLLDELANQPDLEYAFFHIRYPDRAGHDFGWGSPEYNEAVSVSDAIFGRILDAVQADPELARSTSIIVVSDHGGPAGDTSHSNPSLLENYQIPFIVWGPTVGPGTDLYELNADRRLEPGDQRIWLSGPQPIRGHEVGNLALGLLGYDAIPGSTFNAAQDLLITEE